ncbi:MCE family protein [Rhodospirillaceae bacterium KN72]|uniref:MCE family protein n=1 Tax=Pacificispira spongiicola TaxID=2729598 RepID=A0A7Y0E388_9PROT|nr:MlaD family protein [Pacificispira spongiicola]NMM46414.1 MCE family protein [Pacificispira spongiicola]
MRPASKETRQILIGAATVVALAVFFAWGYRHNPEKHDSNGYRLFALFESATGLTPGSPVLLAGIPIGSVRSLTLKKDTNQAIVEMTIAEDQKIPIDSEASIFSNGLAGGKYIRVSPGGDLETLAPDSFFDYVRGSVDFVELFEKIIQMAEARRGITPEQ